MTPDDDGTQLCANVKLPRRVAGRSIMQSPTRKRKEKRTMDPRGSVSATTSASIRKDVPLRLSISLFDDRAPKVLQLRQTSLAYIFLQICLRASDSPVSRSIASCIT